MIVAAVVGLGFASASTWVHYRLLHDPLYSSSICDLSSTFSCTEAYTSRFGSFAGVPVALLGVIYFAVVLGLIAMCGRSATARQNLAGYVFALSTIGLAVVATAAIAMFPGGSVSASASTQSAPPSDTSQRAVPDERLTPQMRRELEQFLAAQPRVTIPAAGGSGASVVIVKFNDYQCPPCGNTFREYKPVLARLQAAHPGKVAFVTKDFPLDPECNTLPGLSGGHAAACEAAAAVRLARERGRADAMEEWLFANQSTLTPQQVKAGAASVAGITDFDARYAAVLPQVRADIAQGIQLGVRGTPTFYMNGLRLQNWPAFVFEAAVEWELRRLSAQ
jgi:protein-disulfide isomerase